MTSDANSFTLPARILHWLMAAMILAMLFIGVGMVASVSERHEWLLRIHKPLGIAILILAVVRLAVRLRHPPPALPADLPAVQKLAAHASHWLLYLLMLPFAFASYQKVKQRRATGAWPAGAGVAPSVRETAGTE